VVSNVQAVKDALTTTWIAVSGTSRCSTSPSDSVRRSSVKLPVAGADSQMLRTRVHPNDPRPVHRASGSAPSTYNSQRTAAGHAAVSTRTATTRSEQAALVEPEKLFPVARSFNRRRRVWQTRRGAQRTAPRAVMMRRRPPSGGESRTDHPPPEQMRVIAVCASDGVVCDRWLDCTLSRRCGGFRFLPRIPPSVPR